MTKSTIKVNIEVAVRARPLNNFESRGGEDNAWEIKHDEGQGAKRRAPEAQERVIQLKNKHRFGLRRVRQDDARASRATTQVNRRTSRSRHNSKSARSVSMRPSRSTNQAALDQSWKYNSSVIRDDATSAHAPPVSIAKSVRAGGPVGTPNNYTPTPFTQQNSLLTPDNLVSEFNLDPMSRGPYYSRPSVGGGRGVSREHMTRSKSLTAISSYSQTKGRGGYNADKGRVARPGAYSTIKPQRSHSQFHTTRKPMSRVRARSHFGKRNELSTSDP